MAKFNHLQYNRIAHQAIRESLCSLGCNSVLWMCIIGTETICCK